MMQAVELRLVAVAAAVATAVATVPVAAARAGPILTAAAEAPAIGQVAPAAMLSQLSVEVIGSGLRLLRRDRASFLLCLCFPFRGPRILTVCAIPSSVSFVTLPELRIW